MRRLSLARHSLPPNGAALAVLSAFGCVAPSTIPSPCEMLDAKATIVAAFGEDPFRPRLFAVRGCALPTFTLFASETLYVLALEGELEDHQLSEGPIPIAKDAGRLLPPTVETLRLDAGLAAWLSEPDFRPNEVRIPSFDVEQCFDARRCPVLQGSTYLCLSCEPEAPAAPALPALPVLTPCPAGWTTERLGEDSPDICVPPVHPVSIACAPGAAQHFGSSECRVVGSACPAGDYADALPVGTTRYVRAGGAAGGTGAINDPFATLAEALPSALPGATIALSKGDHLGADLPAGIRVVGACSMGTRVLGLDERTLRVAGAQVEIRDLEIASASVAVSAIGPGASASLGGVVVSGGITGLEVVDGASVTATDILLRGVQLGALASSGSSLTLIGAVIEDTERGAVSLVGARTQGEVESFVSRRGLAQAIKVNREALLVGRRVQIDSHREQGILVRNGDAQLSDVFVRDILSGSVPPNTSEDDERLGVGLAAILDTRLTLERAVLEGSSGAQLAFRAEAPETLSATVSDLVVLDGEDSRRGIHVRGPARIRLSRTRVGECRKSGLELHRPLQLELGSIEVQDLVVRSEGLERKDVDCLVSVDAHATLTRVWLENCDNGVSSSGASELDLFDLSVHLPIDGEGLVLDAGESRSTDAGRVTAERILIRGGETGANLRRRGSAAILRDLTIRGSERAAIKVDASDLLAERVQIDSARGAGLDVDSDTRARVVDLEVSNLGLLTESVNTCTLAVRTGAICVDTNGELEIERFRVSGSAAAGLVVAPGGIVVLRSGVLSGNQTGAHWSDTLERLLSSLERVQIYENEFALDLP